MPKDYGTPTGGATEERRAKGGGKGGGVRVEEGQANDGHVMASS